MTSMKPPPPAPLILTPDAPASSARLTARRSARWRPRPPASAWPPSSRGSPGRSRPRHRREVARPPSPPGRAAGQAAVGWTSTLAFCSARMVFALRVTPV